MPIDETKLLDEVNHIASNLPHSTSKRKSFLSEWINKQPKIKGDNEFHSCLIEPPEDERPVLIFAEGYNANEQKYFIGHYQNGIWYTQEGRKFSKYPSGIHYKPVEWQTLPIRKH